MVWLIAQRTSGLSSGAAAVAAGEEGEEAGRQALLRHLVRTVASEAFDALLRYQQARISSD